MRNIAMEHFGWDERLTLDEEEEMRAWLLRMNKLFVKDIYEVLQRKCLDENWDNMWSIEKLGLVKRVLDLK